MKKMVKLSELCVVNMGQSPESESYNTETIGLPFYQGNVDFGCLHPKNRIWCSSPKKIANTEDILLSVRAPIGAVNIAAEKCCIGRGLAGLTPRKEICEKKYLYYLLKSAREKLNNSGTGSTFKAINKGTIEDLLIPHYSLQQQRRISEKLDKISDLIILNNKQLKKLDELVKSLFIEMFGVIYDNTKKFSEISFKNCVKSSLRGPFGSDMKKSLYVTKARDSFKVYTQINAIQKDQTLGDYYISSEYYISKMNKFELFPDEYIITCDGTLGKLLKMDSNMEKGVISSSLLKLKLDYDTINDAYFIEFWNSYLLPILKFEARNACLVHLPSMKVIGEKKVPIPPLNLQNQFAERVTQIDKSKFVVLKSLKINLELLLKVSINERLISEVKNNE